LAQSAGVGCDLVCGVAGEERARKVVNLEGPLGDGETSRLVRGTRWTAGLGAGHIVARRARRSHGRSSRCTVAVESRGLVGGRDEHAGFGGFPTKPSEDGFLVWASKPSPKTNTTETGSGRVGKLRSGGHAAGSHGLRREDTRCGEGVAVRWQDPQTLHKCPCVGCIANS
jgi:hypothetical protein